MMHLSTKKLQLFISLLIMLMVASQQSFAQCTISQNSQSLDTEGTLLAQSFIPVCDGELSTISLEAGVLGGSGVLFKLYKETAGSLQEIWSVNNLNFSPNQQFIIDLANGTGSTRSLQSSSLYVFSLEATQLFTLRFEPFLPEDPYTDGCIVEIITNTATCIVGAGAGDLFFDIDITTLLPVELNYFNAVGGSDYVRLDWSTASEISNAGFELERSKNGLQWETITFIEGQGSSHKSTHYHYIDYTFSPGTNYYRLKQIDFDGHFEYSIIKSIQAGGGKLQMKLFPNPAVSHIHFRLSGPAAPAFDTLRLKLYHAASGRLVQQKTHQVSVPLDVRRHPKGRYLLVASDGQRQWSRTFIKLK